MKIEVAAVNFVCTNDNQPIVAVIYNIEVIRKRREESFLKEINKERSNKEKKLWVQKRQNRRLKQFWPNLLG